MGRNNRVCYRTGEGANALPQTGVRGQRKLQERENALCQILEHVAKWRSHSVHLG